MGLPKAHTDKVQNIPEALIVQRFSESGPQLSKEQPKPNILPPFYGRSYVAFKERLAFKESACNYFIVNSLGYLGKYQFGRSTLVLMGVHDAMQFLNNAELQERIFKLNIARNKWILRREIKKYEGQVMNNIKITESGLLAAAHLAGAGNVKRYLRTLGHSDVKDLYGTNLSDYLKKFSDYDVSVVKAEKNPRYSKMISS
ncbi:MAG: hypothetical protein HKO09_05650 [Croceitalea sp.]|nr:hypothetical protein [Croceitalea sp.]